MRTDDEIKEWLAIREREALKDADTAEVTWSYCYFPDPYHVDEDLQEDPAAGRWPGSSARRQAATGPGGPTGLRNPRGSCHFSVPGNATGVLRLARESELVFVLLRIPDAVRAHENSDRVSLILDRTFQIGDPELAAAEISLIEENVLTPWLASQSFKVFA